MTMFLKLALSALVLIGVATIQPARAQTIEGLPNIPPAALALSKEIIALKQANILYGGAVSGIVTQVKQEFLKSNLDKQRDLEEVSVIVVKEFTGRENEIGEAIAKLYAAGFTEQELRDLLAFFKSPLGKKLIENEPKAMDLSGVYMNAWAQKFADDVTTRFKAEMKKRGKEI
jgi:hypothetical protein